MKRTINIILYSVSAGLLLILMITGMAGHRRAATRTKCRGLEIELADSARSQFITASQIRGIIDKEYGGYLNVPVADIDLHRMESILKAQGIMESHEAYFTPDGILHIMAKQCTPVMKVKGNGTIWYLCRGGRYFRVSKDWCKDIPQMTGTAPESDEKWMKRACRMGEKIMDGGFADKVEALKCDSRGEVSMKLKERDEFFLLGQPTSLDTKFKRIDRYISLSENGKFEGKHYKQINIKYDGQIVCR